MIYFGSEKLIFDFPPLHFGNRPCQNPDMAKMIRALFLALIALCICAHAQALLTYTRRTYSHLPSRLQYSSNHLGINENLHGTVFEIVPCPASIKDQTVYISNLPEFLNEGMLTKLLFPPPLEQSSSNPSPSGESGTQPARPYFVNPPPLMIARGLDTGR